MFRRILWISDYVTSPATKQDQQRTVLRARLSKTVRSLF